MNGPVAQAEWAKVREWADAEIETIRSRLESDYGKTETAFLRGRLKAIRALVAWGEPEPHPVIPPPHEY